MQREAGQQEEGDRGRGTASRQGRRETWQAPLASRRSLPRAHAHGVVALPDADEVEMWEGETAGCKRVNGGEQDGKMISVGRKRSQGSSGESVAPGASDRTCGLCERDESDGRGTCFAVHTKTGLATERLLGGKKKERGGGGAPWQRTSRAATCEARANARDAQASLARAVPRVQTDRLPASLPNLPCLLSICA